MRILYIEGDKCSPKYVQGTLEKAGFDVDAVVAETILHDPGDYDLTILSDYPAKKLEEGRMDALVDAAHAGTGLLMVGGWKSFGRGGYAGTPVGDVLPVRLEDGDDRVNLPSGAYLRPYASHAALQGLDFSAPPVVTGYNRVDPKDGAEVALEIVPVERVAPPDVTLAEQGVPVLALGRHGRGRVAALALDLAPHWSGGWTDWGPRRLDVGHGEEVGNLYLRLLAQVCAWVADEPVPAELGRAEARH